MKSLPHLPGVSGRLHWPPRTGPGYREALLRATRPIWASLLVIGENRYRVSSSSGDADVARSQIVDQLFVAEQAAAQ